MTEGLDEVTLWRFGGNKSSRDFGGGPMRDVDPEPQLWLDYNKPGSCHTDFDLEKMARYAWRHHLRENQEYLPDRRLPDHVHLDHVKILGAALLDFKKAACR
jgi:hypothetical protein